MADATAFIRISLHAMDINCSFHPVTFLAIFSLISLKVCLLDLDMIAGGLGTFPGSQCLECYGVGQSCIFVFGVCSY